MRAHCLCTMALVLAPCSAMAESKWLDSRRLEAPEVSTLCGQISGVRLLARMQMISSGNGRWRLLSRRGLVIESAMMGVSPLDPGRCYLIARAGTTDEKERRAFEVRDFAAGPERTSVLTVGHAVDAPATIAVAK